MPNFVQLYIEPCKYNVISFIYTLNCAQNPSALSIRSKRLCNNFKEPLINLILSIVEKLILRSFW